MSDSEKLRVLADWFDVVDSRMGFNVTSNEVQIDLRRIAAEVERLTRERDTERELWQRQVHAIAAERDSWRERALRAGDEIDALGAERRALRAGMLADEMGAAADGWEART